VTAFQIDKDVVGSNKAAITKKKFELGTSKATITTAAAHKFNVGDEVLVENVDSTFNGVYTINSITTTTPFTFTYSLYYSKDIAEVTVTPNGTATSPAPSYIRQPDTDPTLDTIVSRTNFYVEPWDYNTIRVVWGFDDDTTTDIVSDLSNGLEPLVSITRSSFGYPSTPLDGQSFIKKYRDLYPVDGSTPPTVMTTQPQDGDKTSGGSNEFNRPFLDVQSLYDTNLTPGRWYYYSIFLYVKGSTSSAQWRLAGSMDALTPINYKHNEKLYELIPPYYRNKDQEPYSGNYNHLYRFIQLIGFELDYTRTLAEGIENVYNIDDTHDDLMHALGETNFGVRAEQALGDIRYRSILAAIGKLQSERGRPSSLQKITVAATKYACKVIEGINILNLMDDSEFISGTGAWGNPPAGFLATNNESTNNWIGSGIINTYKTVSLALQTDVDNSLSAYKTAVNVSNTSTLSSDVALITCGYGTGTVPTRYLLTNGNTPTHVTNTVSFEPQFYGIRCDSGKLYNFSFYSELKTNTAGNVIAGIMWFNLPINHVFDYTTDFISFTKSTNGEAAKDTKARYTVQSMAPVAKRGEKYVFAVPYIAFSSGATTSTPFTRRVSCCMFSQETNTASTTAFVPDNTLTLGSTSELIGDPTIFIGEN